MAGETCAACTTTYTVGAPRCPNCGSTERTDGPGGSVLPSVTVACAGQGCRYAGRERRVHLRTAAPGVLEMPRLVCAGCGLDMPTVTPWPPVTESEEDTVPKITVHGGPSYAADIPAEPETAEAAEGGEEPSAGSSSETSSPKPDSTRETSEPEPRKPARKTASRSKKATTGGSTAPSTDGGQETSGSAADDEDASS